jgi:membrane protease YdiL (CAAX protease family)
MRDYRPPQQGEGMTTPHHLERHMMSALHRHPLVAFFALSYLLTWSLVPIGSFFAPGPLLAAVIVIALTHGRPGFRRLGSRLIRWRVSWIWYVAAVGVPLTVHALTVAANVALGADAPSLAQLSPVSGVLLVFAVRLVDPLDGPLAEEPGWRGFAQPGLQHGRTPFRATLVLAVLVAGWHLPLWVLPQFGSGPMDIISGSVGSFAVTFWYAWLFNRTGGSILMTLVAHAVEGSLQTDQYWTAGAAAQRTDILYAAVWCAVAVALVLADRKLWWPLQRLDGPTTAPEVQRSTVPANDDASA